MRVRTRTRIEILIIIFEMPTQKSFLSVCFQTDTSNWMRFVRTARTFAEQNLLLCETDQKLFFQTCQPIAPKQELRVGYGQEYSVRYDLPFIDRLPCFECDQKFDSYEALQNHIGSKHGSGRKTLRSSSTTPSPPPLPPPSSKSTTNKLQQRKRRRPVRSHLSTRKVSGPTVRYACCYCSEVFSKFISFKRHNESEHSFVGADEMRSGAAAAAAASVLTSNTKENRTRFHKCEVCRRYFSTAERFQVCILWFYEGAT